MLDITAGKQERARLGEVISVRRSVNPTTITPKGGSSRGVACPSVSWLLAPGSWLLAPGSLNFFGFRIRRRNTP